MPINIGLMGFGRVGRSIFRILQDREDMQITAISDVADHEGLAYLTRYDTILGRNPKATTYENGFLYASGRQIPMLSGRGPGEVDWGQHGVDVVIEATSQSRTASELQAHLDKGGAKRVVCCVPTPVGELPTVAIGVNDDVLTDDVKIVSNASMTAHCAAPIAQALDRAFGTKRSFFTVIHAYSNDQSLGDVPARGQMRLSRAAAENIVPVETNAGENLEVLLPELQGKVTALALKVPVNNCSAVDMVTFTEKPVSREAVNNVIKTAVADHYASVVEYTEDPIVSSDVHLNSHSSVFDSLATMTIGEHGVKTISWYDNGWGYSHRALELASRMAALGGFA
ncbi:MAG: type I glyceraldehyde-3-phosphate dehydrogenase [Myxococcota bacterium]